MNSKTAAKAPGNRTYSSKLRTAQKAETRQHILDALVAKMVQGNFSAVSMEDIAAAAGIGPATLYRHFPNREALLDSLSNEFNRRVGRSNYAETPQDIIEIIRHDFAIFDQHPGLVQAFFLSELGRSARSRGRSRRLQSIRTALSQVTADLDDSRRTQVIAVIAYLASLQSWVTMTNEFGLNGAQVGQAVAWAIDTLIASLPAAASNSKPRAQK